MAFAATGFSYFDRQVAAVALKSKASRFDRWVIYEGVLRAAPEKPQKRPAFLLLF